MGNSSGMKLENGGLGDVRLMTVLDGLSKGQEPSLDELRRSLGSKAANDIIRELTLRGLAGVHRRCLHKADGTRYSFGLGRVAQRGPARFVLIQEDGAEAFLTPKSSKLVLNGDEIRAFLIGRRDAGEDVEAVPVSIESRDANVEHVVRAKSVESGAVVFNLDNRVEDVRVDIIVLDKVQPGDLWKCRIKDSGLLKDVAEACSTEFLGNERDYGIETKLAFGTRFPASAVCVDSEWPSILSMNNSVDTVLRRDVRSTPLVTIDGASTSDFDDAIAAVAKPAGGWEIVVGIADVSAFVENGSALDAFAMEKMTSVYLPHQVHPMLPRSLSSGICSLKPGEDRLVLCCKLSIEKDGSMASYEFFRGVMNSHARLTYENAQCFLDGTMSLNNSLVEASLRSLSEAAKAMRSLGAFKGRLDMGEDEVSFVFDEGGKIKDLKSSARLWTHKIVEECMLAANCAAAEYIESNYPHGMFRNHAGLKTDSLALARQTLESLGLNAGVEGTPINQAQIVSLLEEARELGKYSQARSAILGAMSSADYCSKNKGHFSLAAPHYCHFTSPIRRYADVVVHRLIKARLDGAPIPHDDETGARVAERASVCSKLASQAENEARKLLMLDFVKKFKGSDLTARVSSIGERGLWVDLPLGGASSEFFIPMKTLKSRGMVWLKEAQSWQFDGQSALVEGASLCCRVSAVDMGARRVELAPLAGPGLDSSPPCRKPFARLRS